MKTLASRVFCIEIPPAPRPPASDGWWVLGEVKRLKIDLTDARQVVFHLDCEKKDLAEDRDRLAEEVRAQAAEIKRLETLHDARGAIAKLRELCADRPNMTAALLNLPGAVEAWDRWLDKIDAAGRGEATE